MPTARRRASARRGSAALRRAWRTCSGEGRSSAARPSRRAWAALRTLSDLALAAMFLRSPRLAILTTARTPKAPSASWMARLASRVALGSDRASSLAKEASLTWGSLAVRARSARDFWAVVRSSRLPTSLHGRVRSRASEAPARRSPAMRFTAGSPSATRRVSRSARLTREAAAARTRASTSVRARSASRPSLSAGRSLMARSRISASACFQAGVRSPRNPMSVSPCCRGCRRAGRHDKPCAWEGTGHPPWNCPARGVP